MDWYNHCFSVATPRFRISVSVLYPFLIFWLVGFHRTFRDFEKYNVQLMQNGNSRVRARNLSFFYLSIMSFIHCRCIKFFTLYTLQYCHRQVHYLMRKLFRDSRFGNETGLLKQIINNDFIKCETNEKTYFCFFTLGPSPSFTVPAIRYNSATDNNAR